VSVTIYAVKLSELVTLMWE